MSQSMKQHLDFKEQVESARARVKEISIEEAKERGQNGAILLDVREDEECAAGQITGATHVSLGMLEQKIDEQIPDKDKELVVYCGGGMRSILGADNLQQLGYKKVVSMKGGFKAWKSAQFPTN